MKSRSRQRAQGADRPSARREQPTEGQKKAASKEEIDARAERYQVRLTAVGDSVQVTVEKDLNTIAEGAASEDMQAACLRNGGVLVNSNCINIIDLLRVF